jgi:hypothetical protein
VEEVSDVDDATDAAWAHQQELERQQFEEAAIARARVAARDLERIVTELKQHRKPTNDRHQ